MPQVANYMGEASDLKCKSLLDRKTELTIPEVSLYIRGNAAVDTEKQQKLQQVNKCYIADCTCVNLSKL